MGTLESLKRVIRVATKPRRKEIFLAFRICFLGVSLIGMIGFIIHLISAFIFP